jgi:multiple sugar transport system permease protein
MIDSIVEIILWILIGAIPGFYAAYFKRYNPFYGLFVGGVVGFLVGVLGTRLEIVASAGSAVVILFGLAAIAALLIPRNAYMDERASLSTRINVLAYALVLPTLLIVLGVVIFPLIWNLIFSVRPIEVRDLQGVELFNLSNLTLENYQSQLGLRLDTIPCVLAEDGDSCAVDEEGNIEYVSARRYYEDYRGWREQFGFDFQEEHYVIGVRNQDFYPMIFRTIFYTLSSSVLAIFFGLVAALLVRDAFPGRNAFRGFLLFPYIAPVISVAFIWQVLLRQNGLVNETLDTNIAFLSTQDSWFGIAIPLLMVILFQTWRYFPFAFLFLLARIQAIPDDMYEAARVDGATPSQRLWFITLPQLRAVFGTLFLLRFIWTFNKFDDVFLLTGPIRQTEVIPVGIFEALFSESNVGEASAIAVIMAAMLAVILAIYFRFFLVEEE